MKRRTFAIINHCNTIKVNNFDIPEKGSYEISIIQHRKSGDLYFMKKKNGELCELINLSRKDEDKNGRKCKRDLDELPEPVREASEHVNGCV